VLKGADESVLNNYLALLAHSAQERNSDHALLALKIKNEELSRSLEVEKARYAKLLSERLRAELSTNDAQIRAANEAYECQNRQLEALGEQPNPRSYNERAEVTEAGVYSDADYGDQVRYDHSNVEEYKKERQELQDRLGSREEVLNRLQEEEAKKAKQRLSLEALKRKAEK